MRPERKNGSSLDRVPHAGNCHGLCRSKFLGRKEKKEPKRETIVERRECTWEVTEYNSLNMRRNLIFNGEVLSPAEAASWGPTGSAFKEKVDLNVFR